MPNFTNAKRPSPRHTIVKMAKAWDKERILGAARQKKITYKGNSIRLSVDFSAEILQARREWNDIFKILKNKSFQSRIFYPVKLSFRCDEEIKAFPDKQNLREFIVTRPPLEEIIKDVLTLATKRQRSTKL